VLSSFFVLSVQVAVDAFVHSVLAVDAVIVTDLSTAFAVAVVPLMVTEFVSLDVSVIEPAEIPEGEVETVALLVIVAVSFSLIVVGLTETVVVVGYFMTVTVSVAEPALWVASPAALTVI
jgi:hypothetical protein